MMKNAFYFTLKALNLFFLNCLGDEVGHVEKQKLFLFGHAEKQVLWNK